MNVRSTESAIRGKFRTVLLLGGGAVLLAGLFFVTGAPESLRGTPPGPATLAAISAAVDTLLHEYGVNPSLIRTRRILSPEKKPIRVEQRIPVPREFPTLVVNYRLQELLEPAGAQVFGTERTKDGIVTLHVMAGGVTVRSLAFALGEAEGPPATKDSTE